MGNRNIKKSLILLLVIFCLNSVLALGVNSPYWKDNPLKMYPGETKSIEFILENSVSEQKDAKAVVALVDSQGIAEIAGQTDFTIPPGARDKKVIIKVSVPKEVEIGKIYNVKFSVRSSDEKQSGNIQAIVGYDVDFPVLVVEKSQASKEQIKITNTDYSFIITVIVVLLIAIISYIIYKKNKFK